MPYKKVSMYVLMGVLIFILSACGGTVPLGADPAPSGGDDGPPPATPKYQANIDSASKWLSSSSVTLPDGAILSASNKINPYYANLAAIGMTKNPAYYPKVKAWMDWYWAHVNWPDKWGMYCTIYDYNYDPSTGVETSTGDADSTDSYAATFISLAWAFWSTGDPDAQAYIKSLSYQMNCIGGVMIQTQQPNGLTWAKPDYQIQYLMDNCEVYKGLKDLANLYGAAFNDSASQAYYDAFASYAKDGIENYLWDGVNKNYLVAVGSGPTTWTKWYPDATAQLFPVLYGLIAPDDSRAKSLYSTFNASWPKWTSMEFGDTYPWVVVSAASATMGDTNRVSQYLDTVQTKYVDANFPSPWYDAEAGWFIRVNNYELGNKPL